MKLSKKDKSLIGYTLLFYQWEIEGKLSSLTYQEDPRLYELMKEDESKYTREIKEITSLRKRFD